ncbi:DUF669 domain-containing protein [Pseudomonas sp.]|uniref:DUF669 domain-containing protein n=1 Tax=Pseudomonas sp. TaxID=306 RepID=UPI002584AD38|nr:DUF669 domain-containing protein [Pseudomonas sp.]
MAFIGFNATAVEPATAYDVLPRGKYLAMVVDSTVKPTKNGSGEYLQLTFEIIDGQGKGRKVFERLNFRNSNKTAEEIAQRALSALCRCVGVNDLNDSEQLHNIPVTIDVAVEDGKGDYGPQNRIKGYESAGGQAPQSMAPKATAPSASTAAPAAAGTPVWKRKAA